MRGRSTKKLRRIAPEVLVSVALHVLVIGAMFLLPGLVGQGPSRTQTSNLHAVPHEEQLTEPPPPPPEETPPLVEDIPEPVVLDDPPPAEPPPENEIPTVLDDTMPPGDVPHSRNPRPGPPVIGVGGGAATRPAPPPEELRPMPEPKRTKPVAEKRVSPDYPRRAVERELEGKVLLLVEVLPDGSVGEIEVKESSGHDILDRAAAKAVREWHFRPAYVQGRPVRSLVEVPFSFELKTPR
ncbi:MAG: energy transducer TonB [Planctomycetota bacterium]|jgi:protein TonB